MSYGTGAIMAVPAHDQRDFEFARKYGLEIRVVIQPEGEDISSDKISEAIPAHGMMVNSGHLSGTPAGQAFDEAVAYIEGLGKGRKAVNYRLRD